MQQIEEFALRIGREFHPQRVLLFGSHACGNAAEDSDVDLLVIMPFEGRTFHKAAEIRRLVRPGFPLDLLVRTPEMFQERLELGDDFIREIIERGTVLCESPDA